MRSDDHERAHTRREDWIAITLLTLLVATAFANVIFGGRSLVPSENLNPLDTRTEATLRGGNVSADDWERRDLLPYPNFRDITAGIMQADPSREFLRRSLLRGEFPFWDPYVGGGSPSLASLIPAYTFPPSLLVVLIGNGSVVKNIYILLLIVCAGVLTYFFLRRHALSWQAALTGAIAFSFSGAVIQTAPGGFGQPVARFSLPLIVTARLIELPNPRRAAQLALAFAFVALATFPPILLQTFVMSVVYLLVMLARKPGTRASTVAWFGAGSAVALAMTAFTYLPAVELMNEVPHIAAYYARAAQDVLPFKRLGQILSPTIMGGSPIYAHPALIGHTGKQLYYCGVVALLLAGIGLLARPETKAREVRITAVICSALALAKILGLPPVQWIAYLPFFRTIHYAAYFGIMIAYCLALLAALGVDALIGARARVWYVMASTAFLAATLLVLRWWASRNGVESQVQGWRWISDFHRLALLAALAAFFVFLGIRMRGRARWTGVAWVLVIALLAIEGITNSVYPRPLRRDVWAHPPRYVELLSGRDSGGRILPMPVFPANTESVFRQPTLDVILTASTRMHGLYGRYFGPIPDVILRDTTRIPPERVLDVANIEYLGIAAADEQHIAEAERRGYETLYADDYVHFMRRPTDARYTFTSSYEVATSPDQALVRLASLPRGRVLLERPPSFVSAAVQDPPVLPRLTRFALNSLELAIDTPRAGLLVCSESNMNGWAATIDGTRVPILPANYAFRAVEVPPGHHTIAFAYRAPGWTPGLATTLLGCLACGWGLRKRSDVATAQAP